VRAGGVALGGMTISEAAAALHQTWNVEHKISISDGLQTWQAAPPDLGLSLDPGTTAQAAYKIGHDEGLAAGLSQMFASLTHGWEVEPRFLYDAKAAEAELQAISVQASKPPRDASFYIENGKLIPVDGELGYTVNIEETLARIEEHSPQAVMQSGSLNVALKPVPPAINDVSPAMAEAQRLLDQPVNIKAYDPITDEYLDLNVPQEAVGAWLKVELSNQGPRASIDESRVTDYLNGLSGSIGPERRIDAAKYGPSLAEAVQKGEPFTLILNHNPTSYTVQRGDTLLKVGWKLGMPYWRILQANPGMNMDNLISGQQIVIPSKDDLLPLPVIVNKRIVLSISQQRLWAYQDGVQVAKNVISTGIDRSPTQPGVFQIQTHDPNAYASVWDLHMPNFLGIYEAWPGFMNGIHGLPTLANGQRLWANILGRPASYGCIILNLDAAQWLYDWAEEGVVVEIRP
jgi:lipoprotein-anchoring transpeptidase ErfK/SrfK